MEKKILIQDLINSVDDVVEIENKSGLINRIIWLFKTHKYLRSKIIDILQAHNDIALFFYPLCWILSSSQSIDLFTKTVYKEVTAALNLLNKGVLILLHDYFPNLKSLWSNGSVIPGPFLAIKRLIDENVNIHILPLGELLWPTKLGSNVTYLALLSKNE
jgi:hypothetical protein